MHHDFYEDEQDMQFHANPSNDGRPCPMIKDEGMDSYLGTLCEEHIDQASELFEDARCMVLSCGGGGVRCTTPGAEPGCGARIGNPAHPASVPEEKEKAMARYQYVHRPGYGRDDHLAGEWIARAIRQLGISGTDAYISAAMGFASHPVPMDLPEFSLPAGRGVRQKMEAALRRAAREFQRRPDCYIVVTRVEDSQY